MEEKDYIQTKDQLLRRVESPEWRGRSLRFVNGPADGGPSTDSSEGRPAAEQRIASPFKIGRCSYLNWGEFRRGSFEDSKAVWTLPTAYSRKSFITRKDMVSFTIGISQLAYNQSIQAGHGDTGSGIDDTLVFKGENDGHGRHYVRVAASAKDLARYMYGSGNPSGTQIDTVSRIIDVLHNTEVQAIFPNGDTLTQTVCLKVGTFHRKRDGALIYDLVLHPMYSEMGDGYGELPQSVLSDLKKVIGPKRQITASHEIMLMEFTMHNKQTAYVRTWPWLLDELGLASRYKTKKRVVVGEFEQVLKDLNELGVVTGYNIVDTADGKSIEKVICNLNPYYVRPNNGVASVTLTENEYESLMRITDKLKSGSNQKK